MYLEREASFTLVARITKRKRERERKKEKKKPLHPAYLYGSMYSVMRWCLCLFWSMMSFISCSARNKRFLIT